MRRELTPSAAGRPEHDRCPTGPTDADRVRLDRTRTATGADGGAPERPTVDRNAAAQPATTTRAGPASTTLKLSSYDGRTPLETFLAKFENCSGYYDWDARERLCHLPASLEGDAGQWTGPV